METKKLWSVRELVEESGKTERQIRREIREGTIRVVRIGTYNVGIPERDARKFLEGLRMSRPAVK